MKIFLITQTMMVIKTTFSLVIYLLVIQVNAQSSIQPFNATIEYDKAQRPCIQVNLDPEPKTLKNSWRDYLKDNYDFKLKGIGFLSNKDLLSAEAITVNQISPKVMDFYTHVVEDENGSEMKVFVRHGYEIYITKENYPNEYMALREIVESFIKYYIPKYYEEKINDTEKRFNKLNEERKTLQKKIEKLNNEIKQNEEELKSNKTQLEITERKLIKRKENLERKRIQLKKL